MITTLDFIVKADSIKKKNKNRRKKGVALLNVNLLGSN